MSELAKYLDLPYTLTLRRDSEGDFVGRIEELPGCSAHGKTPQEAVENLAEAEALWIQDCLETGATVPVPEEEGVLPSGKWLQRVPRKLHRKLRMLSKREGVSFNQYVTALLAEAVGERNASPAERIGMGAYDAFAGSFPDDCFFREYCSAEQSAELRSSSWNVVNITPHAAEGARRAYYDTFVMRLASHLPNRSVRKLKEKKKDAKEEHTTLRVS
jgi:predicted RNase H-like HicB family nuclease